MYLMLNSAVETCDCYPVSTPVNYPKCPSCTAVTPSETLCFSPPISLLTSCKPDLDFLQDQQPNWDPLLSDSPFSDPPWYRASLTLDEIQSLPIALDNNCIDDDSGSETEDSCISCGEAYCNRLCKFYKDIFLADLAGKV